MLASTLTSTVHGRRPIDTGGEDLAICLEEWSDDEMAAELPCNHKYHFKCVKKWLMIHNTCPQCRYEMPL